MIEKLKHETEMIDDLEKTMPSDFQRNWYLAYNYELCNKINELVEEVNELREILSIDSKTINTLIKVLRSDPPE